VSVALAEAEVDAVDDGGGGPVSDDEVGGLCGGWGGKGGRVSVCLVAEWKKERKGWNVICL
jgi:hypothetical protein